MCAVDKRPSRVARALAALILAGAWLGASAQAMPSAGDDPGLDDALEHVEHGHPLKAAVVLERLAAGGSVGAMERLALMHWYGKTLFGPGPWNRPSAVQWFDKAAAAGSPMARHMAAVARGQRVAQP